MKYLKDKYLAKGYFKVLKQHSSKSFWKELSKLFAAQEEKRIKSLLSRLKIWQKGG